MAEPMRALTVRQPWCSAIVYGGKRTENRSRAMHYRGPLALHAAQAVEWNVPDRAWLAAGLAPYRRGARHEAWSASLPLGAVVALMEVTGCHPGWACIKRTAQGLHTSCMRWGADGHFHIELADVRPLPRPVPCKGALGLWRLPDEVERAVREQLAVSRG